jgi:hypothetical protein
VAAASASLPMVCPFTIGKAFGLADATQMLVKDREEFIDGHDQSFLSSLR